MICPLRQPKWVENEMYWDDPPCQQEDCAWWSKQGKCAILLLAEKSFNVSVAR